MGTGAEGHVRESGDVGGVREVWRGRAAWGLEVLVGAGTGRVWE